MKIVLVRVNDLDDFTGFIVGRGFSVSRGSHAVLLDHSELETIRISRGDELVALIVSHYISEYYRVEYRGVEDEDEYLRELLRVKHSGEHWRIPVNPLIVIVFDDSFIDVLNEYRAGEYPVSDGGRLVEHYRKSNPNYKNVPKVALARILEELQSLK